MKIIRRLLIVSVVLVLVLVIGFLLYVQDFNRAEENLETYISNSRVEVFAEDGLIVLDGDENNENGIIFYPGGKVEYTAYLPLLEEIATLGYDCYLVEFPFNLAVLDSDKADEVVSKYDAGKWFLMGHSLGGAMASNYIVDKDNYAGLIFLGSYPASDLSETDLKIIQLNGSLDTVLNRGRANEANVYLNEKAVVYEIEGGNHSGFGDYGLQDKDTPATISAEEQRRFTAEKLDEIIMGN